MSNQALTDPADTVQGNRPDAAWSPQKLISSRVDPRRKAFAAPRGPCSSRASGSRSTSRCLESADSHAETTTTFDVDDLVVCRGACRTAIVMKRFAPRRPCLFGRFLTFFLAADIGVSSGRGRGERLRRAAEINGSKINPIGLRLGINRTWESRWFAARTNTAICCTRNVKIREILHKELKQQRARIVIGVRNKSAG